MLNFLVTNRFFPQLYELVRSLCLDSFSAPGTCFCKNEYPCWKLYSWFDDVLSWFMVNGVDCSVGSWEAGLRTGLWCCVGRLFLFLLFFALISSWSSLIISICSRSLETLTFFLLFHCSIFVFLGGLTFKSSTLRWIAWCSATLELLSS